MFGTKVFLTLKIMDFENVGLTKVIHIYIYVCVIEVWMHNIHDIKSIGSQMYLYLKCSAKWGIQNIKF
jgi:hypothetical protein